MFKVISWSNGKRYNKYNNREKTPTVMPCEQALGESGKEKPNFNRNKPPGKSFSMTN